MLLQEAVEEVLPSRWEVAEASLEAGRMHHTYLPPPILPLVTTESVPVDLEFQVMTAHAEVPSNERDHTPPLHCRPELVEVLVEVLAAHLWTFEIWVHLVEVAEEHPEVQTSEEAVGQLSQVD